jgi:hypothetical protein
MKAIINYDLNRDAEGKYKRTPVSSCKVFRIIYTRIGITWDGKQLKIAAPKLMMSAS